MMALNQMNIIQRIHFWFVKKFCDWYGWVLVDKGLWNHMMSLPVLTIRDLRGPVSRGPGSQKTTLLDVPPGTPPEEIQKMLEDLVNTPGGEGFIMGVGDVPEDDKKTIKPYRKFRSVEDFIREVEEKKGEKGESGT